MHICQHNKMVCKLQHPPRFPHPVFLQDVVRQKEKKHKGNRKEKEPCVEIMYPFGCVHAGKHPSANYPPELVHLVLGAA